MRYELSDYEWTAIKPMLPNEAWGSARKRPSRAQWHFLGPPLRCSVARPARDLWSPHHLLQSLRAVATGWRLGPDHGCAGRRS
jgi:transposase